MERAFFSEKRTDEKARVIDQSSKRSILSLFSSLEFSSRPRDLAVSYALYAIAFIFQASRVEIRRDSAANSKGLKTRRRERDVNANEKKGEDGGGGSVLLLFELGFLAEKKSPTLEGGRVA